MLKNYFYLFVRTTKGHLIFALITFFGLAFGIAAFLFIDLYIDYETGFDRYHPEGHQIYRIATNRYQHGEMVLPSNGAMPPLRAVIEENMPEVSTIVRVYDDGNVIAENRNDDKIIIDQEQKAFYIDEDAFKIFGFDIVQGDPSTSLDDPREMAISEAHAIKYFGTTDVVGRTLRITGQITVDYQIQAVYKNAPGQSHFKPDMLFSFVTYLEVIRPEWPVNQNWIWNQFPTYIRITNGDPQDIETRINGLAQQTWAEQYARRSVEFEFFLQPMKDIHLVSEQIDFESNGDPQVLNWLRLISIFILALAWVNYINLSAVRVMNRSREIGVRKAIGAGKRTVLTQFLFEALLTNMIAAFIGVVLLILFKDTLAGWMGIELSGFIEPTQIVPLCAVIAGGMLISLYPGWLLSNIKTTESLKGKLRDNQKGWSFRKILVYLQFIITPALIGGTCIIQQQTHHLMNRDIGVKVDQIMSISAPRVNYGNMPGKLDYFKTQATQQASIESVSNVMTRPGDHFDWWSWFTMIGDTTREQRININLAGYDFEQVLELELIAGRVFSKSFQDSASLVISESTAALWNMTPDEIVGKTLRWSYSPDIPYFNRKVIGVVKDYIHEAFDPQPQPMMYTLRRYTPASFAGEYFVLKVNYSGEKAADQLQDDIEKLSALWQQLYPNDPFNYTFLDRSFQENFQAEVQFSKIINAFTILSLLIAGMGLFGLSTYAIKRRTKEIGVRKVLGASTLTISKMILGEYLVVIIGAYLVSAPIMYWTANEWLNEYSVRIQMGWQFFTLPLLFSLGIGFASIIFQTRKAAVNNPVDALRYE